VVQAIQNQNPPQPAPAKGKGEFQAKGDFGKGKGKGKVGGQWWEVPREKGRAKGKGDPCFVEYAKVCIKIRCTREGVQLVLTMTT
jgi:hypothetical protein